MVIWHVQYWQIAYQKFLIAQNCIQKGSRNIIIFYLRKLYWFWGRFFNFVSDSQILCQILLITNTVLENLPEIAITFLSKKNLDSFLCNFERPKTSDKDFWKKSTIAYPSIFPSLYFHLISCMKLSVPLLSSVKLIKHLN